MVGTLWLLKIPFKNKKMRWKTAFKIALLQPLQMVWGFFDNDNHHIVSKRGWEILGKKKRRQQ